jgi:small subunit ribosomal protein S16
MLRIRFFRKGRKKQPFYKIVVTDKNNPPSSGRFVEEVGFYNPHTKECKIEKERVLYWVEKGAKPSDVVHNLLVKKEVIKGEKKNVVSLTKKRRAKIEEKKTKAESKTEKKPEEVKEMAELTKESAEEEVKEISEKENVKKEKEEENSAEEK